MCELPSHSCSPIRCRSNCRGNLVEADWQPGLPADTQPPAELGSFPCLLWICLCGCGCWDCCPSLDGFGQSQGSSTAGKCKRLWPVVGTAQRQGAATRVHFTGAVESGDTSLKAWGPWCNQKFAVNNHFANNYLKVWQRHGEEMHANEASGFKRNYIFF